MSKKSTYLKGGRPPNKALPLKPPEGVRVQPPDDVPADSVLNYTVPTWEIVKAAVEAGSPPAQADPKKPDAREELSQFTKAADVEELNKRIGLLARLVMERVLWQSSGLTSLKEQMDVAAAALRSVEGGKSEVWVREGDEMPKSVEELEKEREAASERLMKLLTEREKVKNKKLRAKLVGAVKDATTVLEGESNGTAV